MKASLHVNTNDSRVFLFYKDDARDASPFVTESRVGVRFHSQLPLEIDAAPAVATMSLDKGREFIHQKSINKDLPKETQKAMQRCLTLL